MNSWSNKINNLMVITESMFGSSLEWDIGNNNKNSDINILEKVKIGGIGQSVLIRGKSSDNPILLVLHGGPGCSTMGLITHFNKELEDHFLVVNWDQRGTCKSFYPQEKIVGSMSINQFVSDASELIEYLRKRFNQEKIFLIGYSWGSVIGTIIAREHPELLYAYIGTSQVVDLKKSEKIAMKFIIKNAGKTGNEYALSELKAVEKIKPKHGDLFLKRIEVIIKWIHKFGGAIYGESSIEKLKKVITCSVYYSTKDLINYQRGWEFSVKSLWKEMLKINFLKQDNNIQAPVYLIHGKNDFQTPLQLVEKYFKKLKAERKELIVFENSAHHPIFEEPERFNRILIDNVLHKCLKI